MVIKKLRDEGFTLIEIMIVITIIVAMAIIAIPSFLTSRINANEAAAIASSRTIYSACQCYYANSSPHTYPSALDDLVAPISNPPYIDTLLAVNKQKQGYRFIYVFNNPESFCLYAEPLNPRTTGRRYFFVDETGVIRAKTGGRAGPLDPPIA